jgi:hypothetical protein
MSHRLLCTVQNVDVFQDDDLRVHYTADLDDDIDGAREAYRLDNRRPPALDDIHASAGYPNGSWYNVVVPDPSNPSKPFVDTDGFCVSMTSYRRPGFAKTDRRSWVDAGRIPYAVPPGKVRQLCKGILLGCKARITRTTDGKTIDCVCADFSGNRIGEASDFACKFFDPHLSPSNGDSRRIYLYEFFPNTPAVINGETYELQAMG